MKVVLDTSVLVADSPVTGVQAAISVVSITELHFGLLVATDDLERARRADRLAVVEATFDPLEVSVAVSREWGRLAAAVRQRGGQPRRRQLDLAIAATANTENAVLLTWNLADFTIISDLVTVQSPADFLASEMS